VAPPVLAVLRQIGFTSDDELRTELEEPGQSMAKVFFHKLTSATLQDDLPWDAAVHSRANCDDVFEDDDDELTGVLQRDFDGELIQPCIDIPMQLDVLLTKMQTMVASLGFRWFHPNDYTILAKVPTEGVGLTIEVRPQTPELLSMDLHFTHATPEIIVRASALLKMMLAPQ
jgi:hypothetical protein